MFSPSCKRSTRFNNHLPTCTYPNTRNEEFDSSDEDDDFCPYPPSVPITGNPISSGEPLEYISYYMDEHLLNVADNGDLDTVEFFRRYTAGFLISRHESATSLCGSDYMRGVDDEIPDTEDVMCAMFGTTPLVRTERFFTDSVYRINSTVNVTNANGGTCIGEDGIPYYSTVVGCTIQSLNESYLGASRYPVCNSISLEIERNSDDDIVVRTSVIGSETTNLSMYNDSIFRVDGAVKQWALLSTVPNGSNSTFGRQYTKFPNSDITGATIYYNNQVIILTSINCFQRQFIKKTLSSHSFHKIIGLRTILSVHL